MELVVRTEHGDADVVVSSAGADTTVADLVRRVTGAGSPTTVRIDGRPVPASAPLNSSGAVVGSVIDESPPDDQRRASGSIELVQVAGPGAGHRVVLEPGVHQLGPSRRVNASALSQAPVDEPILELVVRLDGVVQVTSVSGECVLIDGYDIGTAPAPWTTGPLTVGGRVYRAAPVTAASRGAARRIGGISVDGIAAFNRPPRAAPDAPPPPLEIPVGGGSVRARRSFPLLAMLAPLPIAVGMALLLGNPRFLLFGLMSPVIAGATWLSDRRERRRELAAANETDTRAEAEFREAAASRHRADAARLRDRELDVGHVVQVAREASPRLWARRPGDDDVFRVALGLGDIDWTPELERPHGALERADRIMADAGPLRSVPITAELTDERGIGIVGDERFTLDAARGVILNAATTHGPADLDIVIATSPDRAAAWEWAKWLPHVRSGSLGIADDDQQIHAWVDATLRGWQRPSRPTAPTHLTMVVVDDPVLWRTRTAPLCRLFADATLPFRFIALTHEPTDLPAVCTTVVHGQPGDTATIEHLLEARSTEHVAVSLVDESIALTVARYLAPLDDPDLPMAADSSLPELVTLGRLLDFHQLDADEILNRWQPGRRAARPVAPLGMGESDRLVIDLVDDGPHALVAGTTGAGKSELLRSLVAGLAASLQPDEINFVLVDFKGGSAFDACARLPHTVGLVTDLDEHLAGRMLRCLRAELHHREVQLRNTGVSSLVEYQQLDHVEPLPRLVLVVDEFASVVAELPEFVPSLVDIAQRGRSLGIHMVLATQRPAGVVDNKIKANTNLRIALRVQDDGDSLDVIGVRDAAALPRQFPGRGYARFAAGELTPFQAAYVSAITSPDHDPELDVVPWVLRRSLTPLEHRLARRRTAVADRTANPSESLGTDLERLVDAISAASDALGQSEQRNPAPPPLPALLARADTDRLPPPDDNGIPFALADLPDAQRRQLLTWRPEPGGSLIAYGIAGSGTSSLIITLALGIAERHTPDDVHLYVIDADAHASSPLQGLPHCGGVIGADDGDRLTRLARHLRDELERRTRLAARSSPATVASDQPGIVLFIDNIGGLKERLDDDRELDGVWADLELVMREGGPLGLSVVITAKAERAVPARLAAQIPRRFVFQLADQVAYAGFGFRPSDLPTFVPGRALRADDGMELQVIAPPDDVESTVARLAGRHDPPSHPPKLISPLPQRVELRHVLQLADREHIDTGDEHALSAPVGIDTRTALPAMATVAFGESFLVVGAARSGRSSVLAALAAAAVADPSIERVFAVSPRGGPLSSSPVDDAPATPAEVADWVERIASTPGRRVVLVDDADRVGGPSFERLAAINDDELIVAFAGRADGLRQINHWTRPLQTSRNGALIRPTASDGELIRVPLGARIPRFARHRGLLVNDGEASSVLFAVVIDEHHASAERGSA